MVCGTALFGPPELPIGTRLMDDDELDELDDFPLELRALLELELPPIGPAGAAAGAGAYVCTGSGAYV